MGLRESGCLRSTLEHFGISIGSRTSFSVKVPVISGYDSEIYIRIPSHDGIGNRNIVTNREKTKATVKRIVYIQSGRESLTDTSGELGDSKQAFPISHSLAGHCASPTISARTPPYATSSLRAACNLAVPVS